MFGDLNFLYQKAPNFFYNRNTNMKLMFLNISKPVKCYRIQSIYIVKREMEKKNKGNLLILAKRRAGGRWSAFQVTNEMSACDRANTVRSSQGELSAYHVADFNTCHFLINQQLNYSTNRLTRVMY